MDHRSSDERADTRIFWITPRIAQGPFATAPRAVRLRAEGVTHVLNVAESSNGLPCGPDGFREVAWHPIDDLVRIPELSAIACITKIHRILSEADSKVYIHCVAGQLRAPAILWLYLVACGIDRVSARRLIEEKNHDAVVAHPRLVDQALVAHVLRYGQENALTAASLGLDEYD
jgi:protein-tyrosine phosphatase